MRRLLIVPVLGLLAVFAFSPSMALASTPGTPMHEVAAHKKAKKKVKKHAGQKHKKHHKNAAKKK